MRIRLRTSGIFSERLPTGSKDDTIMIDLPEGSVPKDAIERLGLPADQSCLVVLNGSSVPKAERATRQLSENDELAIMPPLKGG